MMNCETDVLVVDDDPLLNLGMVFMLRDMGYAPVAVQDPKRVLPMVHTVPRLSLLITDYQMPGMTGVELAREVTDARPGVHVLIVTGNQDVPDELAPGWQMLTKPFTPQELARALDAVWSVESSPSPQDARPEGR